MAFTLSAALLDACVLAALSRGDTYGYELTLTIKTSVEVSESTLYPVLKRLERERCVTTYDEAVNGRNRRYYRLTEAGYQKLAEHTAEWELFKQRIDHVLNTGEHPSGGNDHE